ncbi:uncharacterized protein EV154DRAFT_422723 [Mucor mucedo]|uniref:uncharacterized protein n=1 Tax=Mucor mucedo TaxID=29922 RepID=UPI00221EB30E|nr:uncharacterized protein EV154DRAFT_422723 [Mucor mucedo]KAI7890016.1 hypothetical protein EV154DRAFT_422723 [Mucor mucedo]
MRFSLIRDMIGCYTKGMDSTNNRATHQLREATLIIKRTLQQIYEVFFSKEGHTMALIESYVTTFQKTFLIPAHKSHGNETPSQSAITRLFSPSSNVHLIVRYLPDSLQNYLPDFDPMPHLTEDDVQKLAKMWIEQIESLFKEKLHDILSPIQNQVELIQVRQKLWDLLDEDENTKKTAWQKAAQNLLGSHYSIWDGLYREGFNYSFKSVIDKALNELSNQPNAIIWPLVTDPVKLQQTKKDFFVPMHIWPGADAKQQSAFTLPNFASSKEIETFKASLKETANDRTETLCKLQTSFDSCLAKIRIDVQAHLIHFDHDNFHVKSDTDMIKSYFQDNCYEAALKYSANVNTLIGKVTLWTDKKKRNELSIFLGRLTRNIALLSKELPKSLLLSAETTPIFELRSRINKDPNYTTIQTDLIRTFHQAHDLWIDWLEKEFAQKLRIILATTNWNDQCASISIWESKTHIYKYKQHVSHCFIRYRRRYQITNTSNQCNC